MRIELDLSQVAGLRQMANQVRQHPQAVLAARIGAANAVAADVATQAARDISDRYNLPANYLRGKFSVTEAREIAPWANIAVPRRPLPLSRFSAQQQTAPAPKAKGDKRRGIAKGRKAAGVSVKVLRGGIRKTDKAWFLLPLRAGKVAGGNGWGIFFRYHNEIEHEYGPAPYQAFEWWINHHRLDLQDRLSKAFLAQFRREIRRQR